MNTFNAVLLFPLCFLKLNLKDDLKCNISCTEHGPQGGAVEVYTVTSSEKVAGSPTVCMCVGPLWVLQLLHTARVHGFGMWASALT